jgi:hypothetical protein
MAVVLDAFSRRVIGWALGRTLEADLALVNQKRKTHTDESAAEPVHSR